MSREIRTTFKRYLVLILFLTSFSIYSQAPNILWTKNYGGSNVDQFHSVLATDDGGYLCAGNIKVNGGVFGGLVNNGWLVRVDSKGDTIWTRNYGGSNDDQFNSVILTDDNGYLCVGRTNSYGATRGWLVKVDSNGDTLWTKNYGGGNYAYFESVVQTDDGGYLCLGNIHLLLDNGSRNGWLVKVDSNGDTLWTKNYGGASIDYFFSIAPADDGGYFCAGQTYSYSSTSKGWLVKVNSNGDTLWERNYGGIYDDSFYSIIQINDSGYLCAGATKSNGWLVKIASNGDTLWTRTYSEIESALFRSAIQYVDGGFLCAGTTNSNGWLVKIAPNGDALWSSDYGSITYRDQFYSIIPADSGRYLCVGENIGDGWLMKFDKEIISPPKFSYPSGSYFEPLNIVLTSTNIDAKIYFTLDGSEPTEFSLEYQTPIYLDTNVVIKAKAFSDYAYSSDIVTNNYIFTQNINIIIDVDSLGVDAYYDGSITHKLDASQSNISFGEIVSYNWIEDNDTIATGSTSNIILVTGTHKIILEIKSDRGEIVKDSVSVSVYSAKLSTNGPIYSSISCFDNNQLFTSSLDDKIYSFDSTGISDWTVLTGGDIQSTNCVDSNNIYVGSSDTRLYSFSREGIPNWDKSMGGLVVSSPSISPSGNLYVGISTGRIMALSRDGEIKWSYQTGGSINSSPSILNNNTVICGSDDGKLYSINSLGELNWIFQTGNSITASPALGVDSTIIIGSTDNYIYKLKSSGELLWKYKVNDEIHSSPVVGNDGTVYFGSDDGNLYSLSKEGILNWAYNCMTPVRGTPSISLINQIYFGDNNGKLNVLDSKGNLLWYLETEGAIVASPLLTESGLIYIGSLDGSVYIMKSPSTLLKVTDSFAPQWATFKGNYRRTGANNIDRPTSLLTNSDLIPGMYQLYQNYPNPFNPSTVIKYSLPENSNVKIEIFNMLGQSVGVLVNVEKSAGYFDAIWNASNLPSGIYLISIRAEGLNSKKNFKQVRKALLLK